MRRLLLGTVGWLLACDGPAAVDPGPVPDAGALRVVEGWPSLPEGLELGRVLGVAVHPDGRVYVAHAGEAESPNDRPIVEAPILVFDPDTGALLEALGEGEFLYPHALAFDAEGRLWVTDSDANQVVRLDASGRVDLRLGAP